MINQPPVVISNLSFSYNQIEILRNINLTFHNKEFIWIVGPNGGGKTTLLKLILGLLTPSSGEIKLFGNPPLDIRGRIGYVPQHVKLDYKFPVSIKEIVLMGRLSSSISMSGYSKDDKKAADEAMEIVGLTEKKNILLSELSGGYQRRLLIARAIVSHPDLMILDEPTANLDKEIAQELLNLLKKLNDQMTIIMVSHDPSFVSDFIEKVVCVNHGAVVHPTSTIDVNSISHIYSSPMRTVRHDVHSKGDTL